jgi:hypothetical protein
MTSPSVEDMVTRLRAAAVAGKQAERPHPGPDLGPDDPPEPTGADACKACREGTCGEPCRWCGEPITQLDDRWFHCHGQRKHYARPIPKEVRL